MTLRRLIHESAGRFMDPFRGLVTPTNSANGAIASWNSLFAIAAYLVVMWVVSLVANWSREAAIRSRKSAADASQ